jgi:hypothetical protein
MAVIASWSFIGWECLFPLALVGPQWAMLWCGIAALFHFLVFRFFFPGNPGLVYPHLFMMRTIASFDSCDLKASHPQHMAF